MFENVFNGLFGRLDRGMCRLSVSGGIAVKTSNGYKSYNINTGKLTNVSNFVLPVGDDFFFCIPTNKVQKGDIILIGGKPKCVIDAEKDKIVVLNYEDSTIDTVVPERHVFMGNTYFYGKIISMFGDSCDLKSGKTGNKMLKYMMLSSMFNGSSSSSGSSNILPFMLMGGDFGNIFDCFGDFDLDEEVVDETEEETEEGKVEE